LVLDLCHYEGFSLVVFHVFAFTHFARQQHCITVALHLVGDRCHISLLFLIGSWLWRYLLCQIYLAELPLSKNTIHINEVIAHLFKLRYLWSDQNLVPR